MLRSKLIPAATASTTVPGCAAGPGSRVCVFKCTRTIARTKSTSEWDAVDGPGLAGRAQQVATPIESVLSDELDNFANVDRKQQSMKQKYRIELSRTAIDDEQDIACDSKSAQRQYRIHAKGRENGKRCQKSHVIDPRHWGDYPCRSNVPVTGRGVR